MATLADLIVAIGVDNSGVDKGTKDTRTKFEKTWDRIRQGATVGGAAIGTALAAGLMKSLEQEAASDKLSARINLDPAQQEAAGRIAGDLYAEGYGQSVADINDTFAAVFREVGDIGEQQLGRVTEHAQRFADVFGVDTAAAVKTAGALVKNDLAPDMVGAFDTVTAAAQEINIPTEELLDNLNEYAEPLSSIGVDGQAAIGLMNSALDAGVRNTDKALDAVKEFSIRAIDGSETTAEAYQALGLDADDMAARIAAGGPAAAEATSEIISSLTGMSDPLAQDAAGVALFGTMWEDLGPKAIGALDPMAAGMVDVTGRSEELDSAFDNNASKLETWRREAEQMLVSAVEAPGALGAAGTAVVGFGAVAASSGADIGGLATAAEGLGKLAGKMKIGDAAKALGKFGKTALKSAGRIVALTAATVAYRGVSLAIRAATIAWTAVQWLLNAALLANPIGLIIVAIVALIGIIVLIATKTTWFQDLWQIVWGGIKAAALAVWQWISGTLWPGIQAVWDGIVAGVKLVWKGVKKYFGFWKGLLETVIGWVVGVWESARDNFLKIVDFVKGLPGRIASAARGMWDGIKNAFRGAINWLIGKWNGLSFTIPEVTVPVIGTLGGFTLHTPNLPMLAEGGIVTGPTLAMLGEGGDHEAVVPLPNGVRDLGSGQQDIVLRGDGTRVSALLIEILREALRTSPAFRAQVRAA